VCPCTRGRRRRRRRRRAVRRRFTAKTARVDRAERIGHVFRGRPVLLLLCRRRVRVARRRGRFTDVAGRPGPGRGHTAQRVSTGHRFV